MRIRPHHMPLVVCLVAFSATGLAGCHPQAPAAATSGVATETARSTSGSAAGDDASPAELAVHAVPLPGAPDRIGMDFIAYDPGSNRVWIPASNTGKVDVLDGERRTVEAIDGFPTAAMESRRGTRVVGPTAVAFDGDVAYVGNRANNQICAVNVQSRRVGACATLDAMPDDVAVVTPAHELWVTTPRANSIAVVDVRSRSGPRVSATVTLDGSPECYALDATRGIFYTDIEDRDRTIAIDVATRQVREGVAYVGK